MNKYHQQFETTSGFKAPTTPPHPPLLPQLQKSSQLYYCQGAVNRLDNKCSISIRTDCSSHDNNVVHFTEWHKGCIDRGDLLPN